MAYQSSCYNIKGLYISNEWVTPNVFDKRVNIDVHPLYQLKSKETSYDMVLFDNFSLSQWTSDVREISKKFKFLAERLNEKSATTILVNKTDINFNISNGYNYLNNQFHTDHAVRKHRKNKTAVDVIFENETPRCLVY
jgi:hypothetical protein